MPYPAQQDAVWYRLDETNKVRHLVRLLFGPTSDFPHTESLNSASARALLRRHHTCEGHQANPAPGHAAAAHFRAETEPGHRGPPSARLLNLDTMRMRVSCMMGHKKDTLKYEDDAVKVMIPSAVLSFRFNEYRSNHGNLGA